MIRELNCFTPKPHDHVDKCRILSESCDLRRYLIDRKRLFNHQNDTSLMEEKDPIIRLHYAFVSLCELMGGTCTENRRRLVTLLMDTTTPILKDLLEVCAKNDTPTNQTFTTLEQHLFNKEQAVEKLFGKGNWKYKKIYPNGKPSSSLDVTDSANLDVSVLCSLLSGLYGGSNLPLSDINQVTAIRNSSFLAHGCSTTIQSDDFETLWDQLKNATVSIAKLRSNNSSTAAVEEKIENILISNMPGMWNSCLKWFTSVVEEQADTIQSMRTFLQTGTEVQTSPLANFKTLLDNTRPVNLDQSSTMTERIRSKLITKIPVVITGVECAQYEEVALSLIRKMTNFKEDFCATINDPHEWKDLEEDFVNVVVVKDPFGLEMLDESKTKEMDKIFHSIASRIQNSFSTVILTKKSVLEKAIKFVPHKENKVYSNGNRFEPAGTECYPIDMEAPIQGTNKRVQPSSQVLKNMLEADPLPLDESSADMEIDENQPTPKKRHGDRKSLKKGATRVNPTFTEINPTSDTDKTQGFIRRMCHIENDLLLIDRDNKNIKSITHLHETAIVKELVEFDDAPMCLATLPLSDKNASYTVADILRTIHDIERPVSTGNDTLVFCQVKVNSKNKVVRINQNGDCRIIIDEQDLKSNIAKGGMSTHGSKLYVTVRYVIRVFDLEN
ncbi:hypothetical protein MAR_026934 [Mya arenaria]|uniref:Uncharacterized protein n=1 Tax=Mya arenaria TaxID=6604 RepID=A0ABY7EWF9_MYAAR|nr:hypothetical protein MAR_026934 [Mya arenaria]